MAEVRPGWYHGKGDPEGTVRYWNGEEWVGDPVMAPEPQDLPAAPPISAAAAQSAMPDGTPASGFSPARLVSPHGRNNRATFAVIMGIGILLAFVGIVIDISMDNFDEELGIGPASAIASFLWLWPQLAGASRRFHDFGQSGWLASLFLVAGLLAALLPPLALVSLGLVVFLLAKGGDTGSNKFGPQPRSGVNF